MMEHNIHKSLEIIEKSINWINMTDSMHGSKGDNAYRNFVNYRRKLNGKKFALESNPAAAMYGESQVGKSYLIGSLLSEQGKPFSLIDRDGTAHDFIAEINPPGGGSESTSLVSRFSVKYKPVNLQYPIKAKLLSPADLVLMLCDSFYNDIKASHDKMLKSDDIEHAVRELKNKWQNSSVQQTVFTEDNVLDIQEYFISNFSTNAGNIPDAFFREISLLISKVKPNEWNEIFALLWNRNSDFTNLFSILIDEYQKLNFTDTLYLPIDAVLSKHITLLDVICLKEIYERIRSDYNANTSVLYIENGNEKEIQSFSKSYLCALSAELVFSLPETLLESKPFLNETDLLDLPGIRARKTVPEDMINQTEIPDLLIRGKVAYLFNKYVEAEKINILLFCSKHEQAAQRAMPELLNNYVNKIIGDTPVKREAYIKDTKLPSLFIISTFFNMNMAFDPLHDKEGDDTSLKYRWEQRFERTLAKEMLNTEIYNWFEDWTLSQSSFKNIYLLRDFIYSESKSNLFKGFIESKRENEEIPTPAYPNFRKDLRQSFIDNDFVKRHFENPENSWDRAASINEDGAKLIIDRLTVVANNINSARKKKIQTELTYITNGILDELQKYFHSNNKDEELLRAKTKAGNIQHELDRAFSADGIKRYGQMMKELMLDESSVLELFRKKVEDIEHRDVVNMDIYSTYRMHVPVNENDTADAYFERLCRHYEKTSEEERLKFRMELEGKGIDLEELIKGNSNLIKNNAQQLAESLLEYWFEYVNMNAVRQILAQKDSTALQDILDMFKKLFEKLNLSKKIAEKIRRYVEKDNKGNLPYEIIADISSELLNKCINTVGLEYLDESEINDLRQANDKNSLGLIFEKGTMPTDRNVADLFTRIDGWTDLIRRNPEEMKSLPSYQNYLAWYNRLKIGFVHGCGVPTYNVQDNNRLKLIIDECLTIKY